MNADRVDPKAVGRRVREWRESMGWTTTKFAGRLGIAESTLRGYESGQRRVPHDVLDALADASGKSVDYYLGRPEASRAESLADRIIREQGMPVVPIPILGVIHAGEPIPAEEHIEGWTAIPAEQAKGGVFFALRVKGDCMSQAKIDEGDLVIVRKQPEVENGEVAVVLWPEANEAQVRRVYRRNGQVVLQAANPRYAPDVVSGRDLTIIGLVVGVVTRPAAATE